MTVLLTGFPAGMLACNCYVLARRAGSDAIIVDPFAEWPAVNERRIIRWQRAADLVGLRFDEFVAVTMDTASARVEVTAA